jgi:hypothetical protein
MLLDFSINVLFILSTTPFYWGVYGVVFYLAILHLLHNSSISFLRILHHYLSSTHLFYSLFVSPQEQIWKECHSIFGVCYLEMRYWGILQSDGCAFLISLWFNFKQFSVQKMHAPLINIYSTKIVLLNIVILLPFPFILQM